MSLINEICDRTLANGEVILLARIVDRDGVNIQRADVAEIEYSIYEIDRRWPGDGTVVDGHEAVALNVEKVIFDSLQHAGGWSVDEVGYNFRHEVDLGAKVVSLDSDALVEIRYVLTPLVGEKTIVRFRLKVV